MGKSRLGRMRKYSHRKYRSNANSRVSSPDGVKPIPVHSCGIPIKFQFVLRNVPQAVMHQSSLYSYSCVFTSLSDDGVLNSNWNLIKHSELFLMLCTFAGNATVPEKTVIINPDFSWRVVAANKDVKESMVNVPEQVSTVESFLHLLDFVDRSTICPGIYEKALNDLAMSGGRNGVFKDLHGNAKARLYNETIRPVDCSGLWHSDIICEHCETYKKTLLTMLSNQKSENSLSDKTSASSHCAWKNLNEKEKEERIKNCRQQRHTSSKKIHHLGEKFKKVSTCTVYR